MTSGDHIGIDQQGVDGCQSQKANTKYFDMWIIIYIDNILEVEIFC